MPCSFCLSLFSSIENVEGQFTKDESKDVINVRYKRFLILARIFPVFYISLSIALNLIGQLGNTNIDQDSFTSYFPLIGYMQVLRNISSMKYYLGNLQIIIHHK